MPVFYTFFFFEVFFEIVEQILLGSLDIFLGLSSAVALKTHSEIHLETFSATLAIFC